jgi:hypothetical protein
VVTKKAPHLLKNIEILKLELELNRENDFMEYFKDPVNFPSLGQTAMPVTPLIEQPRIVQRPQI